MKNSGFMIIAMSFLLGIRHGFDLDHLASIDSMTRMIRTKQTLAKYTGFLFSLGHGLIVIIISFIIGAGFTPKHIPQWLESVGNTISIIFLLVFGLLNLGYLFQYPKQIRLPNSLRSYLSKKLFQNNMNPFFIILTGALFALSFDTISQVILFSLSATKMAGCFFSGLLGTVFMLGMMTSDGLNGLFVSALIQRADTMSLILSRIAGLAIASFSLIISIFNLIKVYKNY